MNEQEKKVLNEILKTVDYIAKKITKLEEQLSPQLSETDKKEVMALIKNALEEKKVVIDKNLEGIEIKSTIQEGIEGIR